MDSLEMRRRFSVSRVRVRAKVTINYLGVQQRYRHSGQQATDIQGSRNETVVQAGLFSLRVGSPRVG